MGAKAAAEGGGAGQRPGVRPAAAAARGGMHAGGGGGGLINGGGGNGHGNGHGSGVSGAGDASGDIEAPLNRSPGQWRSRLIAAWSEMLAVGASVGGWMPAVHSVSTIRHRQCTTAALCLIHCIAALYKGRRCPVRSPTSPRALPTARSTCRSRSAAELRWVHATGQLTRVPLTFSHLLTPSLTFSHLLTGQLTRARRGDARSCN